MNMIRDPLQAALDRAPAPVPLFIRDDDAGWADARLFALLDTTAAAGAPIDLAAIPEALQPATAAELLRRMGQQPLGVHQHGFAHTNHESSGRKCEFGSARPAVQRLHDLAQGRQRLQRLLGEHLDPIFTPPWNRFADDTPAQLASLGLRALSRDRGAPVQAVLPELPIHTDWSRHWREAAADGADPVERIAGDLARHVQSGAPVGLMLHHAVMADEELALLRALLERWVAHPQARWQTMRELIPGAPT